MADREVSPVMYLRADSEMELEAAEEAEKTGKQSFYHRMNAMLLSALCLESFLNYWGLDVVCDRMVQSPSRSEHGQIRGSDIYRRSDQG